MLMVDEVGRSLIGMEEGGDGSQGFNAIVDERRQQVCCA
jgi:hypothetical protein